MISESTINGIDKESSVIIIGNSPSILLHEYGSLIDSHDVVIRINNCPTTGLEKFVGKKIDIWATTRNVLHKNNFCPEAYDKLKCVWHRTNDSFSKCILPNNDVPTFVMYKNKNFVKNFSKYVKSDNKTLKGTHHEFCTGLLTILTATLFYKNISILGFTFYTEQSSNEITGYYRNSELNKDGSHDEDKYWKENKSSGFTSKQNAIIKRSILKDLETKDIIKILNKKELRDMNL